MTPAGTVGGPTDPAPGHRPDSALAELARAHGVTTEYTDWKGRHVTVPADTLISVLAGLGVDGSTEDCARAALREHELAPWQRVLPPSTVIADDQTLELAVHTIAGVPVEVWVETESGGRVDLVRAPGSAGRRTIDGQQRVRRTFTVRGRQRIELGYHTVVVRVGGSRGASDPQGDAEVHHADLIVTPAFLGFPASMGDRRTWGLATQLYSVRSEQSWGVGDLTDLTDLAVWSAHRHDAGYVLVNPMHAAEPQTPMEPSPYLPTSRRFFNPLYLRPERIPEYSDLPATERRRITRLRERLDNTGRTIDRDVSWAAKEKALRIIFAAGRTAGRQEAFDAYREREGTGLERHALWSALCAVHGPDWHRWPKSYRRPRGAAVEKFTAEHADELTFHAWLQWCLDEQFTAAQAAAVAAGMELGIVHDLAVGVNPRGGDVWAQHDTFARSVTVGAPPDQFTQLGQDWSQPPMRPDRLAKKGYRPFRDMVRSILRHAGGVRVDHIIGLFRLWWIPAGHLPVDGTYVAYDHDAMVGILALEAHRSGALVVGEDLGTVEPWVREYLTGRGILGTSILWFEQDWDANPPAPLDPEDWREYCLASVTTHDLPPTAGYLAGSHVQLRHRLGLLTDSLAEELARDRADQDRWLKTLRRLGLLEKRETRPTRVIEALHRYLTLTPSRMLNVALVDAVGDKLTQNQPGTHDEYPNWRVPLSDSRGNPMTLEQVFESKRVAGVLGLMTEQPED